MINLLDPLKDYSEESLQIMKDILQEMKEIKELLKQHQEYHTGDGK